MHLDNLPDCVACLWYECEFHGILPFTLLYSDVAMVDSVREFITLARVSIYIIDTFDRLLTIYVGAPSIDR